MSHTRDENKNKWNHHTVICYRSHLLREPGFTPLIFVIIPNPNPQVEKKHCGCFWKTPVTSFWQFTCCIHIYVYTHLLIGSMGMVYLPRSGLISVVNVGKNASPMDPIGYVYIYIINMLGPAKTLVQSGSCRFTKTTQLGFACSMLRRSKNIFSWMVVGCWFTMIESKKSQVDWGRSLTQD